jgi:hypothetical protein
MKHRNMKAVMLPTVLALALLCWTSCNDLGTPFGWPYLGPFDSMCIDREGGGDLGFVVLPAMIADRQAGEVFTAIVSHRNFKDTTIVIAISRDEVGGASSDAFMSSLLGLRLITGDFKQSSLPTGTWVKVYLMNGEFKQEVTNVDLRELLLKFEDCVRKKV